MNGSEGNRTRSRSTSWPRAPPSIGSTTAISTGRHLIVSSATSHVAARASVKRGITAPRRRWYCTSETAASTSIPLQVLRRSPYVPQNRPTMPQKRPKRIDVLHSSWAGVCGHHPTRQWRHYVAPDPHPSCFVPRLVCTHCGGMCRCVRPDECYLRYEQSEHVSLTTKS